MSPYVQVEINKEIDRLLMLGVIEHCESSAWCNTVVTVKKANGRYRICLDARKLNSVTKKNAYPQQQINRILGRLSNTSYLSSIDFSDAFLQVPLDESKQKTAFAISGKGFFCYNRMPFGLCNSGATLCRLIDNVLGCDLEPTVFVYLDDIIIATESFEEHIALLQTVSQRIRKAGLTISSEKSNFCTQKLTYVGYIIDNTGIRPNPEKVAAMADYPVPKTVREGQRLIGVMNWYRDFFLIFLARWRLSLV